MLIVNKTMNEVGFIIEDYNGFTEHKEEELAKLLKNLKVTLLFISRYGLTPRLSAWPLRGDRVM